MMPLLNDITIGRFKPRDSLVHRLDPRAKGLCALILLAATFWIEGGKGLAGGMVLAIVLVMISQIGFSDFLRNLKAFLWLFAFTFILHAVMTPAAEPIILPVIGLRISAAGLENGLFYSFRIALLLAYSYIFMAATSPLDIADGLESSFKPLKKIGFPGHEAAMMLSIALRFVPTLLDEARRIRDAQLCRGARLEGGLHHRVKGFSAMLIPLFASALRRADNLALAMEARGYRGGEMRTSYVRLAFKPADYAAVGITIIAVVLLKVL